MRCVVRVEGHDQEWKFQLSEMERELIAVGGLTSAFRTYGKGLFDVMTSGKRSGSGGVEKIQSKMADVKLEEDKNATKLQW